MQNPLKSSKSCWTIIDLINWTTAYFTSHNIDSSRTTAEIFLASVLKVRRIDLYLQYDRPLISEELDAFKGLIKRRIQREPSAYILGEKEFWSMDFKVTRDVLIPRPETECLVEAALDCMVDENGQKQKRILDLGTGSGAVILALASQKPGHFYFASDISPKALAVASENTEHHGLRERVTYFSGDWFYPLKHHTPFFDIIVSNPPYIRSDDIGKLQPEIYQYEPIIALEGEKDGLGSIRHIIQGGHQYLRRDGYLLLEIDHLRKNDVQKIIERSGKYEGVVFSKDYGGYDRVVKMRKK